MANAHHTVTLPLKDYIESTVRKDDLLLKLQRTCRYWKAEVLVGSVIRPAHFSALSVEQLHTEMMTRTFSDLDQVRHAADRLWRNGSKRPSLHARLGTGFADAEGAQHDASTRFMIQATTRRDMLFANLFDSLRCGESKCSGFVSRDIERETIVIPKEWWSDTSMVCHLADGVLECDRVSSDASPTFRGLTLTLNPPAKWNEPTIKHWFKKRVEANPDGRWFSLEKDWQDAKEAFADPTIPRKVLESLRKEFVDEDRIRPGRA